MLVLTLLDRTPSRREGKAKKKNDMLKKTIKLQCKMPASETCLDRDYRRCWKKRVNIHSRAERSGFLRHQREPPSTPWLALVPAIKGKSINY